MKQNNQLVWNIRGSKLGSRASNVPITLPKVQIVGWVGKAIIISILTVKLLIDVLIDIPKEVKKTCNIKLGLDGIPTDKEVNQFFDEMDAAMFG